MTEIIEAIKKRFPNDYEMQRMGGCIESELQEVSERMDHLSATVGTKLREQDKEIEKLKQDILDFCEMLAQRTKRIEELEHKYRDIDWTKGQVELNLRSIRALEKQYKEIYEMMASWETLKEIRRLKVETGLTKPEPTVKEKIVTDKDNKPLGELEPGDVISYLFSVGNKEFKMVGQFIRMGDRNKIRGGWKDHTKGGGLYPTCEYEVDQDKITLEFRPKFPEPKEICVDKFYKS